MTSKSEKYNSSQENGIPNLGRDDINYDVGRFSFILSKDIAAVELCEKNYILDWDEIFAEYLEVGIGDVPHFASQYVFAKALHDQRTAERAEMQTMYLEIVERVNTMIAKGELPDSA